MVLPVDQLAQSGVQNSGFIQAVFFIFLKFRFETGEFEENV